LKSIRPAARSPDCLASGDTRFTAAWRAPEWWAEAFFSVADAQRAHHSGARQAAVNLVSPLAKQSASSEVARLLGEWGYEVHRGLAGTGVVGTLRVGHGKVVCPSWPQP
jgi:hypothetical protein